MLGFPTFGQSEISEGDSYNLAARSNTCRDVRRQISLLRLYQSSSSSFILFLFLDGRLDLVGGVFNPLLGMISNDLVDVLGSLKDIVVVVIFVGSIRVGAGLHRTPLAAVISCALLQRRRAAPPTAQRLHLVTSKERRCPSSWWSYGRSGYSSALGGRGDRLR